MPNNTTDPRLESRNNRRTTIIVALITAIASLIGGYLARPTIDGFRDYCEIGGPWISNNKIDMTCDIQLRSDGTFHISIKGNGISMSAQGESDNQKSGDFSGKVTITDYQVNENSVGLNDMITSKSESAPVKGHLEIQGCDGLSVVFGPEGLNEDAILSFKRNKSTDVNSSPEKSE